MQYNWQDPYSLVYLWEMKEKTNMLKLFECQKQGKDTHTIHLYSI